LVILISSSSFVRANHNLFATLLQQTILSSNFLFATLLHLPAGFVVFFISLIDNIRLLMGRFPHFVGFFIGCEIVAVMLGIESREQFSASNF